MGSIASTLNSINSSLLAEIQSFSTASTTTAPATSTTTAPAANTTDQVNFSQVGQLFNQLQQLQTSNPSEFTQVLTNGAQQLQAAAAQQTNPNAVAFLNNLAAQFQTAADTGNLSALNPQNTTQSTGATQGHHGHHHGGGGGGDSDALDSTTDTTDTTTTAASSIAASAATAPATATAVSTASTAEVASTQSANANFLSLLSSLNAQSPQNLFSSLFSSQSALGNNTNGESALLAILSSGSGSTLGSDSSQIQSLLASFVASGTGGL